MNPLITVCMAVYRPDQEYFMQQLNSIDAQSYENLELLLLEDCGGNAAELQEIVSQTLHRVRWEFHSNEKNLGSTGTFEKLVSMAKGDLIALCDQDDVWEKDKLSALAACFEDPAVTLAYSDLSVIDGKGTLVADSFTKVRKNLKHFSGAGLYPFFIRRNCVTGCAMMVRRQVVQDALPFPEVYIHDHWLTLWAAVKGTLAFIPRPLVQYRLHGHNQIGAQMLANAHNRDDYISVRLKAEGEKYAVAANAFQAYPEVMEQIAFYQTFLKNREAFLKKRSWKNFRAFWKGRRVDKLLFLLEFALAVLPRPLGVRFLKAVTRNNRRKDS